MRVNLGAAVSLPDAGSPDADVPDAYVPDAGSPDADVRDDGGTFRHCATAAPSRRIRSRPIPEISPPVIDSRRASLQELSPFIQGTLALSFTTYDGAADPADPQDPAYFGHQRTFSSDLPEPQAWVRHMAQALIEVMSGARPAPQVIRWTTPEVYSAVARRGAASGRRGIVARRAIVRQVRICEPVAGVVEACAVVVDNGRVRAMALRLTGVDRRWVVSELQVG